MSLPPSMNDDDDDRVSPDVVVSNDDIADTVSNVVLDVIRELDADLSFDVGEMLWIVCAYEGKCASWLAVEDAMRLHTFLENNVDVKNDGICRDMVVMLDGISNRCIELYGIFGEESTREPMCKNLSRKKNVFEKVHEKIYQARSYWEVYESLFIYLENEKKISVGKTTVIKEKNAEVKVKIEDVLNSVLVWNMVVECRPIFMRFDSESKLVLQDVSDDVTISLKYAPRPAMLMETLEEFGDPNGFGIAFAN